MSEAEKKEKRTNVLSLIFAAFILLIIIIISIIMITDENRKSAGVIDGEAAIMSEKEFNDRNEAGVLLKDDEGIPASAVNVTAQYKPMATEAYELVNSIRASGGISELEWNQNLEACSDIRALEASVYFSHTRPSGASWWTVNSAIQGGENLAYGYNDASSVVNAWMNSPTHAYNIMYNGFNDVSVSIYQSPDGTLYWAQEFGY